MTASPTAERFESAIYRGRVRHRRFTPHFHEFSYPVFMLCLKTDELPFLGKTFWQLGPQWFRWARFRRADYVGAKDTAIDTAVREKLAELTGLKTSSLAGDVFMLVNLRYFGFYFSPLNLYYLRQDGRFRYMLAEVSNTPWNERHYYAVDLENPQSHAKEFHVSPFNPMSQTYRWRLRPPDPGNGSCLVHIDVAGSAGKVFDASLGLRRVPLIQSELRRVLMHRPVQTLSLTRAIYWQALKLYLKKTPLYPHPRKGVAKVTTERL